MVVLYTFRVLSLLFVLVTVSKEKVYVDFTPFEPNVTLKYGIYYTNHEGYQVRPTVLQNPPPKFNWFLEDIKSDKLYDIVNPVWKSNSAKNTFVVAEMNKTTFLLHYHASIENHQRYVFVKMFSEVISLFSGSLKIFINSSVNSGVKWGAVLDYNCIIEWPNSYFHDMRFLFNIEAIIVVVSFMEPLIYDYRTFVNYFNSVYQKVLRLTSAFQFEVIIDMKIDAKNLINKFKFDNMECARYHFILINFIYRWGELYQRQVTFGPGLTLGENLPRVMRYLNFIAHDWNDLYPLRVPGRVDFINGEISESAEKYFILNENWEIHLNITEEMPRILNDLHTSMVIQRFEEYKNVRFIEGLKNRLLRAANGRIYDGNCYDIKSYWNILYNWAWVHGRYAITRSASKNNAEEALLDTWMDGVFILTRTSKEVKDFDILLEDSCFVFSENISKQPIKLDKSLAGVTFNFNSYILTRTIKYLPFFFKLMHKKFPTVEIVFANGKTPYSNMSVFSIKHIVDVINTTKSSMVNAESKTLRYFLNFGNRMVPTDALHLQKNLLFQTVVPLLSG